MHSLIRAIAFLVGAGILAAVAHVTIISTGGYGQPSAAMVIALASGVAVGAVAIGQALVHGRGVLATLLVLALLAGEAFGLLRTADMLVTAREAQQAPIREAMAKHKAAEARVAAAERSNAVALAEAAKAEVDAKAMTASTAPACKQVCKDTLDKQVAAAARAVDDARAAVQAALAVARADLASNPVPASATPLADRLGVAPWALDLLLAGLGSIGCNGLAACLMAFAAHGPRHEPRNLGPRLGPAIEVIPPRLGHAVITPSLGLPITEPNLGLPIAEPSLGLPSVEPNLGSIDAFMLERVQVTRGGRISWARLYSEYVAWCRSAGVVSADVHTFGSRMNELAHELEREVRQDKGQVYFIGLGLKRLALTA